MPFDQLHYLAELLQRRRIWSFAFLLTSLTMPTADARHLNEADVLALEKQCEVAQTPIFDRIRQRKLLECQQFEKQNRGDPKTCFAFVKDVRPGGRIILDPPLPVCEQAFYAREHFGLYPK